MTARGASGSTTRSARTRSCSPSSRRRRSGPDVEPLAAAVARVITEATATDVCFVHVLDDTERSLTLAGATPPFDAQVGAGAAAARHGRHRVGREPPRTRGDRRRQAGRPALRRRSRRCAAQRLHLDGVGADDQRTGRPGRGPQRAHRRPPRVRRPRRPAAHRDRQPASPERCTRRGCTAGSRPASARTSGSPSRSSPRRRPSAAAGPRHPRRHLPAAGHALATTSTPSRPSSTATTPTARPQELAPARRAGPTPPSTRPARRSGRCARRCSTTSGSRARLAALARGLPDVRDCRSTSTTAACPSTSRSRSTASPRRRCRTSSSTPTRERVTLRLATGATGVRLAIADDGVGFDAADRSGRGRRLRAGVGPRARRARSAARSASTSRPGTGTTVTVTAPARPLSRSAKCRPHNT